MIITTQISIRMNGKNRKHFESLGYEYQDRQIILIPVSHLPRNSHSKIKCRCDICVSEKEVQYVNYMNNYENRGYYCCSIKCSRKKYKETCFEKYNVVNTFQVSEIKSKSRETKKLKYGDENFTNFEKVKKTKLIRYNDPNYNNIDKIKETNLKKYGVECVLSLSSIRNNKVLDWYNNNPEERDKKRVWMSSVYFREKSIETSILKYGTKHPMQNREVSDRNHLSGMWIKRFGETELFYRGSYEFDFLEKYYNKIKIETLKGIKYEFNSKDCIYFPDFYLPDFNLIVEIKSDYTYNIDLNKNKAKESYCKNMGYSFIFIIDKDYKMFDSLIYKI